MTHVETGTILDAILARTASDLANRKSTTSIADLEAAALARPAPLSLRAAIDGPDISVIAEVKRASPSRGAFQLNVEPATVTSDYLLGGAAAISVLTDEPFFQGSLGDLDAVASAAHGRNRAAPVLRKDFVIDPYQIVEARAHGADAVLLIVAALDDGTLRQLLSEALACGMDALVEVHDEREMERAAAVGAAIIGINNRDLKSFAVDLSVSEALIPLALSDALIVAESGIHGPGDVKRLYHAGAHAVLVGEALVTAPDRSGAVQALLTWPR